VSATENGIDASPRRPKTNFNCRQDAGSTLGSDCQTRPLHLFASAVDCEIQKTKNLLTVGVELDPPNRPASSACGTAPQRGAPLQLQAFVSGTHKGASECGALTSLSFWPERSRTAPMSSGIWRMLNCAADGRAPSQPKPQRRRRLQSTLQRVFRGSDEAEPSKSTNPFLHRQNLISGSAGSPLHVGRFWAYRMAARILHMREHARNRARKSAEHRIQPERPCLHDL